MLKAVIFDFGGVFLNLDKEATSKELKKLGLQNFSKKLLGHVQDYEKGGVSTEGFINVFRRHLSETPSEKIIAAWNSILLDLPRHRLDFLKKLSASGKYKLILLSNTNDLHIKWVTENIGCYEEFKACFDAFYLSHEINLRKPDPGIFEFVLNENGLKPEQAFFIDDTQEHIDAANKLGIKTWKLDDEKEDVSDLFSKNLV